MRLWLLSIAALALAAGCAQAPVAPPAAPDALFHDARFKPPSQPVRADDAMAVSPAMRDFAAQELRRIKLGGTPFGLIDGLLERSALRIDYDSEVTRNAAQAFEARAGNCLSLVMMTGALAREMGLPVIYHQVDTGGAWSRSGSLDLNLAHVNISIGRKNSVWQAIDTYGTWVTVDFTPGAVAPRSRSMQLSERRIVGMYLVNRSVELMAAGKIDDAYWHARAAIETDTSYVEAYNTLGVVFQRHGDPRAAEAALRHALALQPDHRHAMGNLVGVLDSLGRSEEAAVVRAAWLRQEPTPPFRDYDDGVRALQAGDYASARRLFERELRRHAVQFHELHLNLARVYLHFGQTEAARGQLEKALEFSTTRQQQALYTAKLQSLKAAGLRAAR
jgi:Tfp pilus assembly protein PilF